MATLAGATLLLGSTSTDATAAGLVLEAAHPYVGWTLPAGFVQKRFSIKIESTEPGGFAYTTSGPRTSSDRFFTFPPGVGLNENFAGRCLVTVSLSSVDSGAFEWSFSREVCYDRFTQKLLNAGGVKVMWEPGVDTDGLPDNGVRRFQVQVATDLAFTKVVFDNAQIIDTGSPQITFLLANWIPTPGAAYVYRVRQFDGLDWSDWSPLNAFVNLGNVPGVVTILSVTPTDNEFGDRIVEFTLDDVDDKTSTIEFAYHLGDNQDKRPVSLSGPALVIPTGKRRVTWRSNRDFPSTLATKVFLHARALAGGQYGPEHVYGPLTIDNRAIEAPGGGIGATEYRYPINCGYIARRPDASDASEHLAPVPGFTIVSTKETGTLRFQSPVGNGLFVQHQAAFVSRLETNAGGGWANGDTLKWPPSVAACYGEISDVLGQFKPAAFPAGRGQINPYATPSAFLFVSPLDYVLQSDGWPRPYPSSLINDKPFLTGWRDDAGRVRHYPDGYDWSHRPDWHLRREVYDDGDAWVQVAELRLTDRPVCQTCEGRNWIASAVAGGGEYLSWLQGWLVGWRGRTGNTNNYLAWISHWMSAWTGTNASVSVNKTVRLPCPNPYCQDGFDRSLPPLLSEDGLRPSLWAYLVPQWYRLSSLTDGRRLTAEGRLGLPIQGRAALVEYVQQAEQSPVQGYAALSPMAVSDTTYHTFPTQLKFDHNEAMTPESLLVQGNHGPKREDFNWGVKEADRGNEPAATAVDDGPTDGGDSDTPTPRSTATEQYSDRRTPTQDWNIMVSGRTFGSLKTVPLEFRFMNDYWDAYNTIHYRGTGSESSMWHLQVSKLAGGVYGEWADVLGDNATFSPEFNVNLIPPLTFEMYWATRNRELFPYGETYRLRVRQADPKTMVLSDWYHSPSFKLLEGAVNPVSILGMVYEPWSRDVEISFRIDDSEGDTYNLTKFWYSDDDGETWKVVSKGDILGTTMSLSPTDNPHTILWRTIGESLQPGDDYRFRIEAVPTYLVEDISIPAFAWFSQENPVGDPAQATVLSILGKTELITFDDETQTWLPLAKPTYTPGELSMLELEGDRIRENGMWDYCSPSATGTVLRNYTIGSDGMMPAGWVLAPGETLGPNKVVRTRWAITNQAGYAGWLSEKYQGTESNGQALSRINTRRSTLVNRTLPDAQRAMYAAETYCRKRLIEQGYYAEEHFGVTAGVVDETVITHPITQYVTNTGAFDVKRYWRFKVQSVPEGPSGIYNPDGFLKPTDVTPLERVYYKLQLDASPDFNSQPGGRPLREVLTNENGQRLSVATFTSSDAFGSLAPTTGIAEPAGTEQPPVVTLGGSVKLPPERLPGQVSEDVLPDGQEGWAGDYFARVCAYNAVEGPVKARPRPLITAAVANAATDHVVVDYTAQAHPLVKRSSLTNVPNGYGGVAVTGYQVSNQPKTPVWTAMQAVDFVSERRSPLTDGVPVNQFSWVPRGSDRPQPTVYYDDDLMQYVLANAKEGFNLRWRITTSRAMAMPSACEYESLWENRPEASLFGPWLCKAQGQIGLYFTAQTVGDPVLMRAISTDADKWSDPTPLAGLGTGAFPTVVFHAGKYHLWFQRDDAVFYATSDDGQAFYMAQAGAVYQTSGGIERPAVVVVNGAFVMYVHDKTVDSIVSLFSTDGKTWQGYRVELMETMVEWDGVPVECKPRFPAPFLDRHMGNVELFMAFNFVHPTTGEARVFVARLEDRVWRAGSPGGLTSQAGNSINVDFTRVGTSRTCVIDMSDNDLAAGDSIKVRLAFDISTPAIAEYHRHSEWIDGNTAGLYGAHLNPTPWHFDLGLLELPYMKMTGTAS